MFHDIAKFFTFKSRTTSTNVTSRREISTQSPDKKKLVYLVGEKKQFSVLSGAKPNRERYKYLWYVVIAIKHLKRAEFEYSASAADIFLQFSVNLFHCINFNRNALAELWFYFSRLSKTILLIMMNLVNAFKALEKTYIKL